MDEYFVTSRSHLFGEHPARAQRFQIARDQVTAAIRGTSEDEVLGADADTWARGLAKDSEVDAPRVDLDGAELLQHGPVQVNCTNVPGVSYGSNEWGRVIRDGYRFQLNVPVDSEADLLRSRLPEGGPPLLAEIEPGRVVRTWDWPEVKGSNALNEDVEAFKNALSHGAERVGQEVDTFNASLGQFALEEVEKRRQEIVREREFLGQLTMPVTRTADAPKKFEAPPLRPKATPAREMRGEVPKGKDAEPQLDEFYDHILDVVRGVGRGLERSPGSFAGAAEETLRDHMLVTLNTHYVGATYAEAFNRNGKTDILIRIYDRNAFIGECKWWHGPKALHEALEQLFGYTTWRDSRVALIFYVPTKDITATIETARAEIESRDEFVRWEQSSEDGELRCRVRWPDDPEREATLTALFFHLPESAAE